MGCQPQVILPQAHWFLQVYVSRFGRRRVPTIGSGGKTKVEQGWLRGN